MGDKQIHPENLPLLQALRFFDICERIAPEYSSSMCVLFIVLTVFTLDHSLLLSKNACNSIRTFYNTRLSGNLKTKIKWRIEWLNQDAEERSAARNAKLAGKSETRSHNVTSAYKAWHSKGLPNAR
jgi:hypothetical protein